MTDQGEFKHCEEQSNCTVTCSAGCTGKNMEENSDHNSTEAEPSVAVESSACSGNDCGGGKWDACSGPDCNSGQVSTLAMATVGFVFAAVFLAI